MRPVWACQGLAVTLSHPQPRLQSQGPLNDSHSALHTDVTKHLQRDCQVSFHGGWGEGKQSELFYNNDYLYFWLFSIQNMKLPSSIGDVCEPGSTVPNLAPGRHSILSQAAHPVPAPIFHFIWLSVKNAPSWCLPWGKVPWDIFSTCWELESSPGNSLP